MTESALVQSIGSWLYDKKAKDIIALKVAHLTVITDYHGHRFRPECYAGQGACR